MCIYGFYSISRQRERCLLAFMEWQTPLLFWPQDITKHSGFFSIKKVPSTVHHMLCTEEEELPCLPAKSTVLLFPQIQCPNFCVSERLAVCKPVAGQWHRAERCRLWEYFWEEKLNYHYYQIHLQPSLVQQTTDTHSNSKQSQGKVVRISTSNAVCLHDLSQKL